MNSGDRSLASTAFLWPALAAEYASEFASAMAREFAALSNGAEIQGETAAPRWASSNRVTLELSAVRLRDFSTGAAGQPTLVCAPFALHGATIVDFAPGHSLVRTLRGSGISRVFVTDWRPATPEMRFWSIDDYLATLNVLVDELGSKVDLVGLCQGGWMALTYATRFPAKVRKLVLAGAPIDIAAGSSKLSELALNTPMPIFNEFVELGHGRVLGQQMLRFWAGDAPKQEEIHHVLQAHAIGSPAFRRLEARYRDWNAWTVDLPGTYYLQVVKEIFKENRLAGGQFMALGRRIDLASLRCPLFLLAAQEDDVVAPEQVFATEHLTQCAVAKAIAPCGHLGLFMGRKVLSTAWPEIAAWLAS